MEVLISYHVKVFLGNKYSSYIHTARKAKLTSTKNVYKKIVMKRKKGVFRCVIRTHLNIYDAAFSRK